MRQAMAIAGRATGRAMLEEALRQRIETHRRKAALADLAGLGWDGDRDPTRKGRCSGRAE